ncbi:EAL domain-containing protein [Deinococcus irradiatisoli]|nr:EAL domain-containing protein [Deinococcus irradiatisoli]
MSAEFPVTVDAEEVALPDAAALPRHQQGLLLLERVRQSLTAASDLSALFLEITSGIHQVFGYPLVGVALIEDQQILPQTSVGYQLEGVRFPFGYGVVGRVAKSGQAALVLDVRSDPDYRVYHPDVISQLCVPLHAGDQVIGLLSVETLDVPLDQVDLDVMQLLGQHLGSAVARLRQDLESSATRHREQQLYADIVRQASELALLHQVRNALSREVGVQEIIQAVNGAIVAAFGYTLVSIYLLEGRTLVLQHQLGYPQTLKRVPVSQGVMGRVVHTGQGELIADVRSEPAFLGAVEDITSEVTVPLRVGGEVMGMLNVESVGGVALGPRDLDLMNEVAAQLGLALERAQLLDAVRLSEERYRLLAESMTDLVCLHAPDGHLTYVSPSVTALLGYTPAELIGHPPLSFVHPEEQASLRPKLLGDQPQLDRLRLRLRHRQGHWLWFETSSAPVPSRSGHWQSTSRDISERHFIEQRLAYEAQHDLLTGLANRTLFERRLQECWEKNRRGAAPYTVLFLDLDRFKIINDSLGHRVGDQLLQALAERLALNVPPGALLARMGGDEFALLLCGNAADGERLARRLIKSLKAPLSVGPYELQVNISIGIAPGLTSSPEASDVLRDADLSMYSSKHQRRSRLSSTYTVFDCSLHEQAMRRLHIESELSAAIKARQLKLMYQPVVRLEDGQLLGFEALARWQHPELGQVSPAEFLTVAEETGLIWPLGQWVLEEACTMLSEWQRQQPGAALSLNVNISPQQFQHSDLVRQVQRAISKSGCRASGLNIEITEGAILHDSAAQTIAALRALGVGVQVDDFGTGCSSLASLHRFELTALKIDRRFVDNLGKDKASHGIVRAILMLAEALNLSVIAEGIETEQQRRDLLALDCVAGQGYLFAAALSAEAATRLCQRRHSLAPNTLTSG